MLKLVKNELYKIFHKKSTFIFLIITIIYAILTNYLYTTNNSNYYSTNDYSDNYYDEDSVEFKAYQEVNKLLKQYNKDNWQYYVKEKFFSIVTDYYYALENNYELNEKKNNYESAKKAITNEDWQYFVNLEITDINNNIAYYKERLKDSNVNDREKANIRVNLFVETEKLNNLNYRLKENVPYGNDFLNDAISNINDLAYSVGTYNNTTNESDKKNYEDNVKEFYEYKYVLEKKENTMDKGTTREVFINLFEEYNFMILIFIIMIAGAIMSDEFNKGTIKSLLITPYHRSTILLSKFLAIMIMIPLFVLFISLIELIIGGIFLGFNSIKIPVVIYNLSTKNLEVLSLAKYVLINFIANLPQIILLTTLAFALSTILTNTAFAIAITFCGMIGTEIINALALSPKFKFLNYFVTTNWDFTEFLFGGKSQFGNSLPHAIIVCLVYFAIMMIVSLIVFKKKDIKNI